MSRAAHPQTPPVRGPRLRPKPFICGKTNLAGDVCTLPPRHQRSRCSWQHYGTPWAHAATLGPGTPAPPFTGTPADTSARKARADRQLLKKLKRSKPCASSR